MSCSILIESDYLMLEKCQSEMEIGELLWGQVICIGIIFFPFSFLYSQLKLAVREIWGCEWNAKSLKCWIFKAYFGFCYLPNKFISSTPLRTPSIDLNDSCLVFLLSVSQDQHRWRHILGPSAALQRDLGWAWHSLWYNNSLAKGPLLFSFWNPKAVISSNKGIWLSLSQ